MLMIALGICSAWLRYRRRLYHSRPFQWFALCMGPAGLIARRRVGDHRDGPPAVGDIRVVAHAGCGVVAQHPADGHQPAGIYRGLLRRVWRVYTFSGLSKGPQPVTELTSQTAGTPARPLSG